MKTTNMHNKHWLPRAGLHLFIGMKYVCCIGQLKTLPTDAAWNKKLALLSTGIAYPY